MLWYQAHIIKAIWIEPAEQQSWAPPVHDKGLTSLSAKYDANKQQIEKQMDMFQHTPH